MTTKESSQVLEYLDPTSPSTEKKLVVPTIGELKGKQIAFVSNGWPSFTKIGARMETALKEKHGIAGMRSYAIPTAGAPAANLLEHVVEECDAAVVGLAN